MVFKDFIYRQHQRIQYHTTRDRTTKQIAEINRFDRKIWILKRGYWMPQLEVVLPREKFDFIFHPRIFDLFLSLPSRLNGKYHISDTRLLFIFDELKIEITSKSELYILNEIYFEKCYQFWLPSSDPVHVVDIGMNVGIASLFFAGLSGVKQVHSYEPFEPSFRQALINFEMNSATATKIRMHNFGLGINECQVPAFHDTENSGVSTTINDPARSNQMVSIKSAQNVLNTLFLNNGSDDFILKLDTEGAEYEIFQSLFETQLSEQVKGFMIEWHRLGSAPLEEKLLQNGFKLASLRYNANSGIIYAFR